MDLDPGQCKGQACVLHCGTEAKATAAKHTSVHHRVDLRMAMGSQLTWQDRSRARILVQMKTRVGRSSSAVVCSSLRTYGKMPTESARSTAQSPMSRKLPSSLSARSLCTWLRSTYITGVQMGHNEKGLIQARQTVVEGTLKRDARFKVAGMFGHHDVPQALAVRHLKIWKYDHSDSKARLQVLQHLLVAGSSALSIHLAPRCCPQLNTVT